MRAAPDESTDAPYAPSNEPVGIPAPWVALSSRNIARSAYWSPVGAGRIGGTPASSSRRCRAVGDSTAVRLPRPKSFEKKLTGESPCN
ncbi:hypothetical protein [Kitasatospora paracochleata]|uniref:Uncharacterized protein n=1 Tax=Kitasatospora paracochleata TaxID=58354 RepID=A0ABT1J4X1_9ACTN|nr:hypothetical protein [Kitasatospora paracochleata]